jgi:hypothetical protein
MEQINYLTDYVSLLPSDQKYICLSFLSDNDNKSLIVGVRFGGAFSTYEQACLQAEKLQSVDQYFNIYVGEGGKWLPFNPNPDSDAVQESQYANKELNNMMKSYMENQEKAKIYHEQRKQEMIRENILENVKTRQENLQELNRELENANKNGKHEEINTLELNIKTIEEQINKMEEKKKELDQQIQDLGNQVKAFTTLEAPNTEGPKIINV